MKLIGWRSSYSLCIHVAVGLLFRLILARCSAEDVVVVVAVELFPADGLSSAPVVYN